MFIQMFYLSENRPFVNLRHEQCDQIWQNSTTLSNIFNVYLVLSKVFRSLWHNLNIFGQIFITVNCQIFKKKRVQLQRMNDNFLFPTPAPAERSSRWRCSWTRRTRTRSWRCCNGPSRSSRRRWRRWWAGRRPSWRSATPTPSRLSCKTGLRKRRSRVFRWE